MEDVTKMAMEVVKAQASVRPMTPEEVVEMLDTITKKLSGETAPEVVEQPAVDILPKNSVKEKSVICLECGKSFKVLTKRHLATHGITPEEYREKYGLKKGFALVAKALQRSRRARMKEMKLWERRGPIKGKKGPQVESKFPGKEEIE